MKAVAEKAPIKTITTHYIDGAFVASTEILRSSFSDASPLMSERQLIS